MSRAAERASEFVGINWGSSNFRAYRIRADGAAIDDYAAPAGVARLDRAGIMAQIAALIARWPDHGPIYASGMIGSNIGWAEVPYALAPAGIAEMAGAALVTDICGVSVSIVPGIACRRSFDGAPDILRGEEIELLGLASLRPDTCGVVALPGTHTKWAMLDHGRVTDFFTSMSGEMFDSLTAQGLLASIVEGEAADGEAFHEGVASSKARQFGLGTLLFGARARVIRGELARADAASYVRGLLIGAEIADALFAYPQLAAAAVPLIGNGPLSQLYASALDRFCVATILVDSREACLTGFRTLHEARSA